MDNRMKKIQSVRKAINMTSKQPTRPTCTRCGRELVQSHITAGDKTFSAWLCDCLPQPQGIHADIVRSREWEDEVLFYTIEYHSRYQDGE